MFSKNEKELGALIQTVQIYNQVKGMGFGTEKCAMLIMKCGKRYMTDGMKQSNQEKIRTLGWKEN